MSMTVIIRETKEEKTLSMIDNKTGISYERDFIDNNGGFVSGDFEYDYDSNTYFCDQKDYEWWEKVCADNEAMENRIQKLREEHGVDAVEKAIGDSHNCALEDLACNVNAALDEAFGPQ